MDPSPQGLRRDRLRIDAKGEDDGQRTRAETFAGAAGLRCDRAAKREKRLPSRALGFAHMVPNSRSFVSMRGCWPWFVVESRVLGYPFR